VRGRRQLAERDLGTTALGCVCGRGRSGYEIPVTAIESAAGACHSLSVHSADDHSDAPEIRALREGDRLSPELAVPAPDDGPRWRRSRVALVDGHVVGVASLTTSALTDSSFCEVIVAPGYRRRGIGTRLYAAVYQLAGSSSHVLTRAMSSQPLRRQFAESIGCSVLAHCPEPWIDPAGIAGQQWIRQQRRPAGYTTAAIKHLPSQRVQRAWAIHFDWVHRPFGTVDTDRLPQVWVDYSQGLDLDSSMVSIDSSTGEIVALSLVTPDAWDDRTMIVSETVERDQADGSRLLRATVAASLEVLAHKGTRLVELEGHTTDAHSPALVSSLPTVGGDPMDILKLAPPT
jgi:GNAT superfamily N-acetyltransferase